MTIITNEKTALHVRKLGGKDVKSGKTESHTNSQEESVSIQTTGNQPRNTILPGYTPVYDGDRLTYQAKHQHQGAHVYTEQVYDPARYGKTPRYYIGVNDDLQPMTFPELHQFVTEVLDFYGKAAADHRALQATRTWTLVQENSSEGHVWYGPENDYVCIMAVTDDPALAPRPDQITYEIEPWTDLTGIELSELLAEVQDFKNQHPLQNMVPVFSTEREG